MGAAKRELEVWEEFRGQLERLACDVKAIEYDSDKDAFVSNWDGDAERHAYAKLTIAHKRGAVPFKLKEAQDLLRDILDGARLEELDA
jgi:hypothetical protein